MFFGTPVWPLKWEPPYDETIKRVAKMGFKGIELIGWTSKALNEYYTKDVIEHLNQLIASLGMVVTNFDHTPEGLCSEDPAIRAQRIADFKRAVDVAESLHSKNVTMVAQFPFGHVHKDFPELRHVAELQQWSYGNIDLNRDWKKNYDQYVESVRELCAYAAEKGLRVLVEAHPYRWVNSGASMLRLIEHVGADNLGMNFDPSHLFPQGDMPEWTVHMLKGRIWHTHFSDNDTLTNVHWRPGQGKINWKAVMKALNDTGYQGTINFELEDVGGAATPEAAAHGMSDEMEYEIDEAKKYITNICMELGIKLD
jgi:sugar phosphate isomerase/epimerase